MALAFALAQVALGFAQMWQPRRFAATMAICAWLLASYAWRAPVASNNQFLGVMVALCMLAAAALTRPFERDEVFHRIAMPGRWLLAVLYFYGIFHKINADFLDPQVSCAVELYRRLAWPLGLQDLAFGHYGAIYLTFVAEGTAMLALFSRRWKKLGFLIGVPFHILIGLSGYAFYLDFCVVVFACYALFLPPSFFAGANAWLAHRPRLPALGRALLALLAVLIALAATGAAGPRAPSPYPLMPLFLVLSGSFLVAIWRWLPWRQAEADLPSLAFRPAWLALLPLLYFASALAPYVGLRTEASIAMFSNLHTEAGRTNHLLFAAPPYLFDDQREVDRLLRLGQRAYDPAPWLVRYEIDRRRAAAPGATAIIERDGVRETLPPAAPNRYRTASWLTRKLLLFKPVDFTRPKPCSH